MDIVEISITTITAVLIIVVVCAVIAAYVAGRMSKINKELNLIYGTENDLKKRIEQYVAKVARDELSRLVEEYKESINQGTKEIVSSFRVVAEGQIASLGTFIRDQQGLVTKQAQFIVGEVAKKAQSDVEDYKKLQYDAIDLQVTEIVERVSKEVLGRVITKEEHEKLIWDAVQLAKKQGIFMDSEDKNPKTTAQQVVISKVNNPKAKA